MTVCFLTKENKEIEMSYFQVNDFCKSICMQEQYQKEFQKFAKKYTYFEPYFDFCMERFGWILKRPLGLKKKALLYRKQRYELLDEEGESYEELVQKEATPLWKYSYIVPCSDKNLQIKMATIFNFGDSLIETNRVSMMTNVGSPTKDGSHTITANTILNQLLISNETLVKHVEEEKTEEIHYALKYLVVHLGFLHCDGKYKNVLGNHLNETLKNYLVDLEKQNAIQFLSYAEDTEEILRKNYEEQMKFRR